MNTLDITIAGTINADGSLQLDQPANLPPGPVQVTLRSRLAEMQGPKFRAPDEPWLDQSMAAPFDLPRPAPVRRVYPRRATVRLPDPILAEDLQP